MHPFVLDHVRRGAGVSGCGEDIVGVLEGCGNCRIGLSPTASPAKGTFVHPDAFDLLRGAVLQEPIADPKLRGRVAAYLADQQAITRRFHAARTTDDRNAALNDLLRHADAHGQLIDDVIRYHANHGDYAGPRTR
jgi:hypothetical protein